jgi:hypothetical protein
VHGGGPPSTRQNNGLPDGFNPVNHPIQLGEMTESGPGVNPRGRVRPGSNRGEWRSEPNWPSRGYPASS